MKIVFSILVFVGLILCLSETAGAVREEALVLYYSFDAGTGDTAEDVSGNGHDGSILGSPEWIDSDFGKALSFEGKAQPERQYVDIQGILPIGNTDNTVAMWVRIPPDSNGGGANRVGILLGNYNKSLNCNWEIHGNGQVRIWWNNGEHDLKGSQDLRDSEWHHLAFVRNKAETQLIMYVDGEADGSIAAAGSDVVWLDTHWVAGDKRGDGSHWYHGDLDELAIWNVALNEDEIKQVPHGIAPVLSLGKLSATWGSLKQMH